MDVGQHKLKSSPKKPAEMFRPFARPRKRRRHSNATRPTPISVRPNPPTYALNFTDGDGAERSLLSQVLSGKRIVCLVGLPGSGKSVIMRGLAYHPSISSTFRDGIYFIQLDKDPSVKTLLYNLHEVVSCLCGSDPASTGSVPGMVAPNAISALEEIKTLIDEGGDEARERVIDHILAFMHDKRFLIMFDHVTLRHKETFEVIRRLIDNAPRSRRFTFICSTRTYDVAREFECTVAVELFLLDPTGDAARDILCAHAGFDRYQFDVACNSDGTAIMSVLRMCSGLALALAVAGGAVKRLLESTEPDHKGVIWSHYETYLTESFHQFGEISGLFKSLSDVIDGIIPDRTWRCPFPFPAALAALSAIRHNTWIPYVILQRLWDIKKKEDVITVVRPMGTACLVSRERRSHAVGIIVPSVVLDYSRFEAYKQGWTQAIHVRLLKSYADELEVLQSNSISRVGTPDEISYLKDNIQHHVAMATKGMDRTQAANINKTTTQALRVIQKYYFNITDDKNPSSKTAPPGSPRPEVLVIPLETRPDAEPQPASTQSNPPPPPPPQAVKAALKPNPPNPVLNPQVISVTKPEANPQMQLVMKTESNPVREPELVTKPESTPVTKSELVTKPESNPVTKPESATVTNPESKSELETSNDIKPKAKPETNPTVRPKSTAVVSLERNAVSSPVVRLEMNQTNPVARSVSDSKVAIVHSAPATKTEEPKRDAPPASTADKAKPDTSTADESKPDAEAIPKPSDLVPTPVQMPAHQPEQKTEQKESLLVAPAPKPLPPQALPVITTPPKSANASAHLVGGSTDPNQRQVVVDGGAVETKPTAQNGLEVVIVGD